MSVEEVNYNADGSIKIDILSKGLILLNREKIMKTLIRRDMGLDEWKEYAKSICKGYKLVINFNSRTFYLERISGFKRTPDLDLDLFIDNGRIRKCRSGR